MIATVVPVYIAPKQTRPLEKIPTAITVCRHLPSCKLQCAWKTNIRMKYLKSGCQANIHPDDFVPSWSPILWWLYPLCLYINVTLQTLHRTCRVVRPLQSFLNQTLAEMLTSPPRGSEDSLKECPKTGSGWEQPSVCTVEFDAHTPARLCVSLYVVMKCSGAKRPYLALRCDFRAWQQRNGEMTWITWTQCQYWRKLAGSSSNKMLAIGSCGWTMQILWMHTLV